MFAVIFICGSLFLRMAGKTTKVAKITTAKISCHTELLLATVSVNKTCNSLFAVGKLAKGCFTSISEMEKTMASLQAFLSFPTRATHVLSRTQIPPSPFNACHAGYDLVLGGNILISIFKNAMNQSPGYQSVKGARYSPGVL